MNPYAVFSTQSEQVGQSRCTSEFRRRLKLEVGTHGVISIKMLFKAIQGAVAPKERTTPRRRLRSASQRPCGGGDSHSTFIQLQMLQVFGVREGGARTGNIEGGGPSRGL